MNKQWHYIKNQRGVSTVELLLITCALVSVALIFKDSLIGFTEKATVKVFAEKSRAERMTFGGETKTGTAPSAGTVVSKTKEPPVVSTPATPVPTTPVPATLPSPPAPVVATPVTVVPPKGTAKETGVLKLPKGQAIPTVAQYTNTADQRGVDAINTVLNQFKVQTTTRYQPVPNKTFCNIFAWDATSAMNAEIPHWIDRKTNMPYTYNIHLSYAENAKLATETNVNRLYDWMQTNGNAIGYREVSEEEARKAANMGKPAVALWKNPAVGHSGHIVVLRPYDAAKGGDPNGTYIAQAGSHTYNYINIEKVFGSSKMKAVKLFIHE